MGLEKRLAPCQAKKLGVSPAVPAPLFKKAGWALKKGSRLARRKKSVFLLAGEQPGAYHAGHQQAEYDDQA